MAKNNLYIDIDGVLLGKKAPENVEIILANHAEKFLKFCISNYDCFWLTTHCKDGTSEELKNILKRYADSSVLSLIDSVATLKWNTFKTEAIDYNKEFYWIEDQLLAYEIDQLKVNNALNRWVQIDTRKDPDGLLKAMKILA